MALKKIFTSRHGIEISNAYIRVEAVRLIGKNKIEFSVCVYFDPLKSVLESTQVVCGYDLFGENPIAQAYSHLKTLPEFADAVDC